MELQDILDSGELSKGFFGDNADADNKMVNWKDVKAVIGTARLDVPYDVIIPKPDYVLAAFDDVVIQTNGVVVSTTNHNITVENAGYYKFSFSFNGYFAGNDDMKLMPFINGVEYSSDPIIKSGEGNNDNIVVTWTSIAHLNAGDIVDLRLGNNDTSSGNINLRVKRLFFGVELIK